MALNGIDIASWDAGIPIADVPADFVIVKATQGISYINPYFGEQYAEGVDSGRLMGIYHYAEGRNPIAEAQYFLDVIGDRVGKAILVLDWEGQSNPLFGTDRDTSWCKQWCEYIEAVTGVTPVIYVQKSAMHRMPDYPLWVAQYASMEPVYGYQDTPWNEGKYDCLIRQYTDNGHLSNWNGNLDLNKFYGDRYDWIRQASGDSSISDSVPNSPDGSVLDLAVRVMKGEFGNGDDRRKNLGTRYQEVQDFINEIAMLNYSQLADNVILGKYGNGEDRKILLAEKYPYVQTLVNQKLA